MKGSVQTVPCVRKYIEATPIPSCSVSKVKSIRMLPTIEYNPQTFAVETETPKAAASNRRSAFRVLKRRSTVHSMLQKRYQTSELKSAEPKAAARFRRLEWQVQKRQSTGRSTPRLRWSTSKLESTEPKAVINDRLLNSRYENCGVLQTAHSGRECRR